MLAAKETYEGLIRRSREIFRSAGPSLKEAGAKAIATTSAGLAWAHGYGDGEKLPVDILMRAIREITRIIDLPVTVDLESGFTDDLTTFARTIEGLEWYNWTGFVRLSIR